MSQLQTCKNCKHFLNPMFGFPMCKKLKMDTTEKSKPKKEGCFDQK